MNDLSWMIYAADLVGGLDGTASGIAGIATLAGIGSTIGWFALGSNPECYSFEDKEARVANHAASRQTLAKAIKWSLIGAPAAMLVASLIPSANTVYAIAASEVGEEVVKSPTATKAMKALDAWLDRQITDKPSAE